MTKKQTRILIGTTIALLIIGAGLFTGWFFSTHKIVSVQEKKELAAKEAEPNFNTYEISPPSRATILQTHDVAIGRGGTTIFVSIPKKDAGDIKTGQRVLLYTAIDIALETLGEVTAVEIGTDQADSVTVTIAVTPNARVDLEQARRASIVINRIPAAARLPLSALIKDDKGEPLVWEAVQGRDGTTTAYLKKIYITAVTNEFFVIGEGSQRGALYILNPDDALRDGQKINTKYAAYQGPHQTEDARIEALMEDRRRENMDRELRESLNTPAPAQVGGNETGCAAPANYTQDFIDKIKAMSGTPSSSASPPVSLPAAQ